MRNACAKGITETLSNSSPVIQAFPYNAYTKHVLNIIDLGFKPGASTNSLVKKNVISLVAEKYSTELSLSASDNLLLFRDCNY